MEWNLNSKLFAEKTEKKISVVYLFGASGSVSSGSDLYRAMRFAICAESNRKYINN